MTSKLHHDKFMPEPEFDEFSLEEDEWGVENPWVSDIELKG